jgi:hypothetical protein
LLDDVHSGLRAYSPPVALEKITYVDAVNNRPRQIQLATNVPGPIDRDDVRLG